MICHWCDDVFPPRQSGGKTKVYCKPVCRMEYNNALRGLARDKVERGELSIQELREFASRVEINMHGDDGGV